MLIDAHIHAFAEKIAARAISQLETTCHQKALTDGKLSSALALLDEWGVDKAVLLPIATKPTQQRIINDWAAENNQGKIVSFGSVHPEAEDLEEELYRIKELGLRGIKLHPDYQGFFINEPRVDRMFSLLEELGLPVTIHAGLDPLSPDLIYCEPEPCAEMLRRHPKLRVILAHMGGNERWQDSFEHICGMSGEVYLDTSYPMYIPDELMFRMIRRHGASRVLFASDCPWTSSRDAFEKIDALPLTDDEKEQIFFKNAQYVIGI